ncbi:MAG: LPS export ABC transporter periplasmic protein LptC [Alphaproteobacteria bacterium]|nr:LPS export ABC transporter periplasmic protein LptC [Alphaproteobacteria bacterium]MBN2675023.1 LPS export ABC transporter periplasmic protein LptC [Alphaproteobacteria bacterium]
MRKTNRNFIIFDKHRRWKRLWQFFFTGWGLVMVAALVAGTLFTKQLLWTPISAINMKEIVTNQFKMSNASFAGTDKNNEPFKILAGTARQEYDRPDMIYIEKVNGTFIRITDGQKIKDNVSADTGEYNRNDRTITLFGSVRVDSDNGDKILTDELMIQL